MNFCKCFLIAVGFLIIYSNAMAKAQLCVPKVHPHYSRRIDIQFPTKSVALVGHQHPSRDAGVVTIESLLQDLLWNPRPLKSIKQKAEIKRQLRDFLQLDVLTLKHWNEDLEILEEFTRNKSKVISNFEYTDEDIRMLKKRQKYIFTMGPSILRNFDLSETEIDDLMKIAITPGYYLKNKFPDKFLNLEISTAEGDYEGLNSYSILNCNGSQSSHEELIEEDLTIALSELERFFIFSGLNPLEFLSKFDVYRKSTPNRTAEKLIKNLNQFAIENRKIFPQQLIETITAGRLNKIVKKIYVSNSKVYDYWSEVLIDQSITDVVIRAKALKGCWPREALIAKNMATSPYNEIVFLGSIHFIPLTAQLYRECIEQIKSVTSPH